VTLIPELHSTAPVTIDSTTSAGKFFKAHPGVYALSLSHVFLVFTFVRFYLSRIPSGFCGR